MEMRVNNNLVLTEGDYKYINCNVHYIKNENDELYVYITSDDEIKPGDWFVNIRKMSIHKCKVVDNNICSGKNNDEYHGKFECKKIVATTNDNLTVNLDYKSRVTIDDRKICYSEKLPKIPKKFIEFLTNIDKSETISTIKLLVEMNEFYETEWFQEAPYRIKYTEYFLKQDNGCISIKSVSINKNNDNTHPEDDIYIETKDNIGIKTNALFLFDKDLNDKFKKLDFEKIKFEHFKLSFRCICVSNLIVYVDKHGNSKILKNRYGNIGKVV